MNIGEEQRTLIVEPMTLPAPLKQPEPQPEPVPVAEPAPEEPVPA